MDETKQKEVELKPFSPSVMFIDAAPGKPTEGITQSEFLSNHDVMKKILGSGFVSDDQLQQEFGEDYKSGDTWKAVLQKYPQMLFTKAITESYLSHGQYVIATAHKVWKQDGKQVDSVKITPLQKIFDEFSLKDAPVDELGNKGKRLVFDEDRVIDLLRGNTSDVINCSFQIGNVDIMAVTKKKIVKIPEVFIPFRYEALDAEDINKERVYLIENQDATGFLAGENNIQYPIDAAGNRITPISADEFKLLKKQKEAEAKANATIAIVDIDPPRKEIIGSYAKEKAMENLPKLFQVCSAYPDKLFVFAAGNEGEDMREALRLLGEKRPKNLLLVAQWGSTSPYDKVYGADLYVDNAALGINEGSSFSAPAISAIASELRAKYSLEQTIQLLKASTKKKEFEIKDEDDPVVIALFDPSAFEQKAV